MVTSRKVLSAAAALAVSALPIKIDPATGSGFSAASAYAKSENGGGNDKGGGSDRGNSGDRGNGGGKGGGSSNGKSASAPGKNQSKGNVQTTSGGGLLSSLFGPGQSKKASALDTKRPAPKNAKVKQNPKAPVANVLPASVVVPGAKPARNLHARLAGLNSLNRNYHAYLNSQSPRMALVREYVLNSANAEIAADAAVAAAEEVTQSQAALDAALAGIVTYDGSAPVDGTLTALADRRAVVEALVPADEVQAASIQKELDGLTAAIAATNELAAAEQELADAQAAAVAAGEGTGEGDLKEALLAAANPNRVAEYGEDYLDDEVMDWAKGVLGVGEAYGKIDEVKATLQKASAAERPAQEAAPVLEP